MRSLVPASASLSARTLVWLALAFGALFASVTLAEASAGLRAVLVAVAIACAVHVPYLAPLASAPLRLLWRAPLLFWLAWLGAGLAVIVVWLLTYQPAIGQALAWQEVALLVGGLWATFAYFSHRLREALPRLQGWWLNPFVTLVTLVLVLLALELGLRYLVAMSDNFALSKMHQNWHKLYWKPINTLGFRDNEPNDDPTRTHLIVMGDSFPSGYGVNDIADTFPHQLGARLGEAYAVNVVAVPGVGIGTALADVMKYPVKPQILVVSHYINDLIEGAARGVLPPFAGVKSAPSADAAWWIENFYLANFLYYRVYHYFTLNVGASYADYIRSAYANPDAWQTYEAEELDVLMQWTQENDIALYVVVWHNLVDREGSLPLIAPVLAYFEARGVPTLNTAELFADVPPAQLTANAFDAHPNARAHARVAEALYTLLKP
jgi:hypothetical protein